MYIVSFIARKTASLKAANLYRRCGYMIERYKLLHGKYYGELSNLGKLQADHVLKGIRRYFKTGQN